VNRTCLYFTGDQSVEVREEPLPDCPPDQLLVQTHISAISAGTEMLYYRGMVPDSLLTDVSIEALRNSDDYPMKYGYAVSGEVVSTGADVSKEWSGQPVFVLHPHESHFCVSPEDVITLPNAMEMEDAVFLANTETAVNLLMDGAPIIGERVHVFGQGVVGLLVTALLRQYPQLHITTYDLHPVRREKSLELGADRTLDPTGEDRFSGEKADLTFELSGSPAGLNQALRVTGFEGRIVVGSWYGTKQVPLELGDRFHRSRIRLISSQVSSIAGNYRGRWSHQRRMVLALESLESLDTQGLISHRFGIEEAGKAYELLHRHQEEALQVILTY